MRRSRGLIMVFAVAAAALVFAGCSSAKQPSSSKPSASVSQASPTAPVQIGMSPGGVTTSVSAPADSTEQEYYQACHWARVWMSSQPADPHTLFVPYLAMVQKSSTGENGTWHTPWAKLTPERQSAVIVAARAAADGGCD